MKRFMNTMYALNVFLQAFWSLLFPIGAGIFFGWLLTERGGMGNYVFVILIVLGVAAGLVSMIRFLISALSGLERLEKEQNNKNDFQK
ncbi:MAG: AtpZ/AtpI family protein [Ruminococcaceae bacterium]|nr:AtpZ/AtpI family protein [Oscillospiraceae bacterium]